MTFFCVIFLYLYIKNSIEFQPFLYNSVPLINQD